MQDNDRLSRLMTTKEEKIAAFEEPSYVQENFSNSNTDTNDGYVEHNGNKLWGISDNWSKGQNAFARDYIKQNYSLPNSSKSDRRLYEYGTKDIEGEPTIEGYDPTKVGVASGKFDTSDRRYIKSDDGYGWESGERGVDVNKKHSDDNLDFVAASALEALGHSSKVALENRLVRKRKDGYYDYLSPTGMVVIDKTEKDKLFGSGASEYYNSHHSIYDDNYNLTDAEKQEVISGVNKALELTAQRYNRNVPTIGITPSEQLDEIIKAHSQPKNRFTNTLKGFGASFVTELLGAVDAAGEITGLYDLGTEDEISHAVNKEFGYNDFAVQQATEKAGQYFDVMMDKNSTVPEMVRAAGNMMLEAFTTPEMLGTSLGTLMAWVMPGSLATKAVGKGSKYLTYAKNIDKAVKAGEMTWAAGKVAKARNFMSIDGMSHFITKQSGFIATAIGNVNHQYDEFIKNNNGKELEGVDKLQWLTGRFAVQMINQNLDKLVDVNVIKSAGVVKSLVPAVKSMKQGEFLNFTNTLAKGLVKTSLNAGSEAVQEYAQSSMELFNARFGSEAFKDLDTVVEFLSAPEHVREAGIAAFMGAGGAGQFETLGAVSTPLAATAKFTADKTAQRLNKNVTTAPVTTPAAEEQLAKDKETFKQLLVKFSDKTEEDITETNISSLLDDLDELNRTHEAIKDVNPESKAKAQEYYDTGINKLVKFIEDNPRLKLSKRIVRKTLGEEATEATDTPTGSLSDNVKDAFRSIHNAYSDSSETTDTQAIEHVVKLFKTSSLNEPENIKDELIALEVALTGKASENLDETVTTLEAQLKGKKAKDFFTAKKAETENTTETGAVLGTGPSFIDEEQDYDDNTRLIEAERIVRTVLGSGKEFTEIFRNKATAFAIANGMDIDKAKDIVKSYASVEDEATVGKRGYKTYLNRLQSLVSSSNPDIVRADATAKSLLNMQVTLANSAEALERGIQGAINKAKELNKNKFGSNKSVQFETEYKKTNKENYVIHIKNVDGVWQADTAHAQKLVDTKLGYVKEIKKGWNDIVAKANGAIGSTVISSGTMVVPLKENKHKTEREKDINYINKVTDIVDSIVPDNNGISKVILGKETHAKWAVNGDYYKSNSEIINTDTYSEKDVVLIDSRGLLTNKNHYSPNWGDEGKKAIDAAIEAGATLVLDGTLLTYGHDEKLPAAIAGYVKSKNDDYIRLDGIDRYIFVKKTPENVKNIKAQKDALDNEKAAHKLNISNKEKAVSFYRAIEAGKSLSTGKPLTNAERLSYENTLKQLRKELLNGSFKGNEEKLDRFLERESTDSVVKEAKNIIAEGTPPAYTDKVFEAAVIEFIETERDKDAKGLSVLEKWRNIFGLGLNPKDRDSQLSDVLRSLGVEEQTIIYKTLNDKSFAKGKDDLYESVYLEVSNGVERLDLLRKNMSDEEQAKLFAKNNEPYGHIKFNGKKHLFKGVRRVVQDVTKLVNVTKTTVANTLPIDYLPLTVRDAVSTFKQAAKKALDTVQAAELAEQTDTIGENGKFLDGGFHLHNSPARGLFFNNEGEVNDDVIVATYLAIGDMLNNDKTALSRGWKSDHDVAQMFGVEEFEVTKEMREFAYGHGSLLKTAANSLGKNILAQLGLSKRKDSETTVNEYEAFLADVGNTALLIAEKQGLISSDPVDSNKLAKFYKDGEILQTDSKTHFVHITDKKDRTGSFTKNVPVDSVVKFAEAYTKIADLVPEASTTRIEPFFTKPDKTRTNKALNKVRNDITGKEIPKEAKEAIKILMNTAYRVDLDRINEILDAVDAENSKVKSLLGYIEVDDNNEEFNNLYYQDKEVQQAKNDTIDKSLEELRLLRDKVTALNTGDIELYFDYFYSSNDRYMLDSNTINPQVDKLHRFLIVPKEHNLDYNVVVNGNGGLEFYVDNEKEEYRDQSYVVRMALAQAFGQDVDKERANTIIEYGNAVLSLTTEQIANIRKDILENGKATIESEGKDYKIEAAHLSHTLQALKFLEETQKAVKGDGKFSSDLSLEFDSLTSGFANKIQQMPILDRMDLHLSRVGIIIKEYQDTLRNSEHFYGKGTEFSPIEGTHAINDLLALGENIEFLDSYKAMAEVTIRKLQTGDKQKENLTQSYSEDMVSGMKVFDTVKPLLPGGAFIDAGGIQIKIEGEIRKLFKNPFMIFNYSAGIGRIIKNLSTNTASNIVKTIATTDLEDSENASIKAVAENLIKTFKLVNTTNIDGETNEKRIRKVSDLVHALRTNRLANIKLVKPFVVKAVKEGKEPVKVYNLEQMLEHTVSATYGATVEEVFNDFFEPFIKVQDAMNDLFKVSFRIFDKKRIDRLNEIRKSKKDHFLSVADYQQVFDELWDDFPWFAGPLSNALSEVSKDGINVVTTSTRSPNIIEQARKKPQAVLPAGSKPKTRTVTPLVKYLEEAISAGSVLPFHAIDGAEMARTLIGMGINGIAAIHDAVVPPLNRSDETAFEYQRSMETTNTEYVLVDKLAELVNRINVTVKDSNFDKDFKDLGVKGLKVFNEAEKTDNKDFPSMAKKALSNMQQQIDLIRKKREEFYGENGKLKGAWYGNLVSTPGGMYQKGMTEPNLSYKTKMKNSGAYKPVVIRASEKELVKQDTNHINVKIDETTGFQEAMSVIASSITFNTKGC